MTLLRAFLPILAVVTAAGAQSLSQKLPAGARIEAQQGAAWRRGVVSEDQGPGAAQIKVRLDPDNRFMIVARKSIRAAPAPTSIQPGDRVE